MTTALPVSINSLARAGVMRGTTALAASTKSLTLLAMPDDNPGLPATDPLAACRHNGVTTEAAAELGRGFDNELGLEYIELTPDGGRARLEIKDKLLQPWGIVHG